MSDEDAAFDISSVSSVDTQPVIPPIVLFSLNPAQAMQGVINFVKCHKVKLHRKYTSRLSDDPFDCVPKYLHQFLKTLLDRATEYQWNDDVLGIPMILDHPIFPTKYTNLLTNHMN